MKWPKVDENYAAMVPLPAGYRFAQLNRADVEPLTRALKEWMPGIAVGANSGYLREDFYVNRVCLDGADDKDIMVTQILYKNELVGMWSQEREVDSLAIYGRLFVLAPEHRGAGVAAMAMLGSDNIVRSMGAAFVYAITTLKHPYAQQACERAGYRLLGMWPGYDRDEVSPGVVKRVYQAIYAKLLVSEDDVHWPDPKNLSPRAAALYELLFSKVPDELA